LTDDSTKRFFQKIVDGRALATVFDFENREDIFPGVGHGRFKFCLLTLSGAGVQRGDLAFFLTSVDQLLDERRRFQLSADDFALMNPNTRTCPVFRTRADAELVRAFYRRVPVLVDEVNGVNPWGVEFLRMLDMSGDSHLFRAAPGPGLLPLYEAKLFSYFNHRLGTYAGRREGSEDTELPRSSLTQLQDPCYSITPRYWIERDEVERRLAGRWDRGWLIAFRDITKENNERTSIFDILPRVGAGNSAPLLLANRAKGPLSAALIACLASLIFDYATRPKVGNLHLNFFLVKQFPVLPPSTYTAADLDFVVPRVLELTYTAWDLQPFAKDLGYDGPPFRWDEDRRAVLRAELDAYYAALYGLNRDELRYVLDPTDVYGPDFPGETFRVLKEREIREYGEYRTRRLVLEAWDRLGLEPRNREGRYVVEATSTAGTANGSRKKPNGRSSKPVDASPEWPTSTARLPGMEDAVQQSFGEIGGNSQG
jgi:hypothetical protein